MCVVFLQNFFGFFGCLKRQSLGSFLTACCCEIRGKSWLKWQVFLSSPSHSPQPALKAQLAATAPGLSCRHFWLQTAFLFTQFSSTCSCQCFWEATGKTEGSRPWVFYCWRSILCSEWICVLTLPQVPHTSRCCSSTLLHGLLTQLFFSSLFSHLVPDKRDTRTLISSLFIPSCSEFLFLPCMVPRV